jgi:signal transduction histidine kinase
VNGSRSRTPWFVLMALVVAGLSLLAAISEPRFDPEVALTLAAAALTAGAAVAAVAAARFRDSRDPHALYVSVAFLVLALQQAVFGIWWPAKHATAFFGITATETLVRVYPVNVTWEPASTYALQTGWIVAGVLLLLALPWWDRRGRPPVRLSRVVALSLAAVVGADVLLVALFHASSPLDGSPGVPGWMLGIAAMALLIVAAWREWNTRRAAGPYLTAALLLGVALQVAVIADPSSGYPNTQWADVLQPLIPAIVLAGLLMEQRTEASRLRRASDRAQEVMGGRAEIASMIAHEVRGPVSTVRGIASTSLTHFDRLSDEERREFLEMIEQESGRLMETVDQMSLALKVDAGTLAYQPRTVDLGEVVRAGVEAADVAEHTVEIDAPEGIAVVADERRLKEVLRQLVANAARYSPAGSSIHVSMRREPAHGDATGPDHALIEVADEGPGIPHELRERVFEKFPNWRPEGYQDQPGTGLGLFICRGIVREHAGEIHVVEGPGGGTMLRVRIPVGG